MTTFGPQPDSLFGQVRDDERAQGRASIDDRFRASDREHPEVFRLFREYAERIRAKGHERYSADAILHRIRWHYHIERGERDFAINNDFASRYSRLLMTVDPSFAGFFETRELREPSRGHCA